MNRAVSLLPCHWNKLAVDQISALTPVQRLSWPLLAERGIDIAIKRDDLLDPKLSGNKLYKLHGHLEAFFSKKHSLIASFGGAYSNHIYALAAAGQSLGISTVGIIRGDEARELSPTLKDVKAMGMQLLFVSRVDYKKREDPLWLAELESSMSGPVYWVPEGGGGDIGVEGCTQWGLQAIKSSCWRPTHLCVAAGTGSTAAGLLAASDNLPLHAFLALKGKPEEHESFTQSVISMAQQARQNTPYSQSLADFYLETEYHCGGYARVPQSLKDMMLSLEQEFGLLLDPVYTAKLFWGIAEKAKAGYWPRGSRLLVFHTGGLQGRRGYSI